jgi:hypothetical protein
MSQPEPEVDRIIPAYYGKKHILAYSENPRLYYLFESKKLDRPAMTSEDREEVRSAFLAKEPDGAQEALVRCPSCRSRWVWRISGGEKVGEAMVFGVYSIGRIAKTFRCGQCTYTW